MCCRVVPLSHVGLFADGAAVRVTGTETFKVARSFVDGMITVSTDEVSTILMYSIMSTKMY